MIKGRTVSPFRYFGILATRDFPRECGLELSSYRDGDIENVQKDSSADKQGLKEDDYIFSINKTNVVGESNKVMEGLLRNSGSSVEIGVLKPKKFDANLRKFTYS